MTLRTRLRPLALSALICAGALSSVLTPAASAASDPQGAGVYTMTNAASGNAVLAFKRGPNGALTPNGSFPTGGTGTGAGLGSGHSIAVSDDGSELVVVNAGSNSISAFRVDHDGLRLLGSPAPSGGSRPVSVTINGDLVYALNADSNSIAGFRLKQNSGLTPIANSVQPLGSGTNTPSQIQFDRTGHVLIADERGSNTIDTFVVDQHGVAGPAMTTPSNAGGPFGFDVNRQGHVLFSAAALSNGLMSGATSYDVSRTGVLTPNGGPVSSGQAAACWLAAAGSWAYTTNAGSGSIGRFSVARDGSLSLIGTTTLGSTSHPLDEGVSRDQDFLYVLADGLHQIDGFRVGQDGGLTQVSSVNVPTGSAGIGAA